MQSFFSEERNSFRTRWSPASKHWIQTRSLTNLRAACDRKTCTGISDLIAVRSPFIW